MSLASDIEVGDGSQPVAHRADADAPAFERAEEVTVVGAMKKTMLVCGLGRVTSRPSSTNPLRQTLRIGVILGEAVDVVVERVKARRRGDAGLAERAADHVLQSAALVR